MNQTDFAAALLDPALPTPQGLTGPDGQPATKRFAVYRNNVAVSLTEVLGAAFPAIRKLVGPDFFAAMAREFIRHHPPRTRIMMLYGARFAGFLATFPPVAGYPYLPDVARLEQSLRESYHAADASPIAADVLSGTPAAALLACGLTFAPTLRLIRSPWPVHAIWRASVQDGPPPHMTPEDVLILRPKFDPNPVLLPQGAGDFIAALLARATLAEALSATGPDFDLPTVLTLLLDGHAITGLCR